MVVFLGLITWMRAETRSRKIDIA